MSEIERARQLFNALATPEIKDKVNALVEDETLEWVLDPYITGVVGCVIRRNPNRAVVVVYINDQDFEVDEGTLDVLRP